MSRTTWVVASSGNWAMKLARVSAANFSSDVGVSMIPLSNYIAIKNKYCITYNGPCADYLIQLVNLRPIIEKQFPGLEVHISYADRFHYLLENEPRIIQFSKLSQKEFSYIRELKTDMYKHPVLELLEESKITIPPNYFKITNDNRKCVIVPNGVCPPNSPIKNVKELHNMFTAKGYHVEIDSNVNDAGCVVGIESEKLYWAATHGIRTFLVPTGIGTRLYSMMFQENAKILNI